MITVSLTRPAAAVGALALSLTAAAGVASADPDLDPVVSTTCNYSQVVDAMKDQSTGVAAQFNATPAAQTWLQNFLAAPAPQRQEMIQQAQGDPGAAQFVELFRPLADTCSNY